MSKYRYYFLSDRKRFLSYPFRLSEIGWLPGHTCMHKNAMLKDIFICMTCNYESSSVVLKNDELVCSQNHFDGIHFNMVLPGTKYHTIKPAMHDELYFRFDVSSAPALINLVGEHADFYFNSWPKDLMQELQELLNQLDKPGVADKVDQLAVKLISQIILEHIEKKHQRDVNVEMRIFTCANMLETGGALRKVIHANGFSLRSFYREWKKFFDISPKEYVIRKRIEMSMYLLEATNLSNTEIADMSGFQDVKRFYSCFKKSVGITPGKYRKSFNDSENAFKL